MKKLAKRTVAIGAVLALPLLVVPGSAQADSAAGDVGSAAKISHSQAASMFQGAGIPWTSSGNCSDRNKPNCTSFEQIHDHTVRGAITLKSASGCAINVTGGTETGHADGQYSHWNGYKLDMSLSSCIQNYVDANFAYIGGSKWQSGSGNVYYREGNHWDITFHNCGGC
ncbi:hypothetical protein JGS22_002275 [Streptomyces sp. P38-E01]|uniref:Uncharacterized protein n=1 Tax=Streptomyces tardus TaxID=2780544 RepID=A0A949N6J6_9ACTN|nr:hypothetical protein [Streptomyces tardus]MBU7596496.1 hypothetical protein [Streptomyces tardus]